MLYSNLKHYYTFETILISGGKMEQASSGTAGSTTGQSERTPGTFRIDWAGTWQLAVDSGIQSGPDSRAPSVISRRSLQSTHTNQTALESLGDPDEWSAPPSVSPCMLHGLTQSRNFTCRDCI